MSLTERERRALATLGRFLLMHDRAADADALFGALARAANDDPFGWYGLALAAERRADIDRALTCFERASTVSDDPRFALSWAECLVRAHRYEDAIPPLQRASRGGDDSVTRRAQAILRRLQSVKSPGP